MAAPAFELVSERAIGGLVVLAAASTTGTSIARREGAAADRGMFLAGRHVRLLWEGRGSAR
ncbi:MAG: hypothetical protein WCH93_04265 [Actinomycetota bacterium]